MRYRVPNRTQPIDCIQISIDPIRKRSSALMALMTSLRLVRFLWECAFRSPSTMAKAPRKAAFASPPAAETLERDKRPLEFRCLPQPVLDFVADVTDLNGGVISGIRSQKVCDNRLRRFPARHSPWQQHPEQAAEFVAVVAMVERLDPHRLQEDAQGVSEFAAGRRIRLASKSVEVSSSARCRSQLKWAGTTTVSLGPSGPTSDE